MKSDAQIQQDVIYQLKWEPLLISSEIGVAVKDGVVTLSGIVDTYTKKLKAEMAAKKISGVKAVALDIQVGVSPFFKKTDAEIAGSVLEALRLHTSVPEDWIKVKVEDGSVSLEGEVEWEYQRSAAKSAVENLTGVRNVFNYISVKPKIAPTEIKQKINAAFHRSATIDAGKVIVESLGNKVILNGTVRSLAEREDAEDAAWSAPGVSKVDNHLQVVYEEAFAF